MSEGQIGNSGYRPPQRSDAGELAGVIGKGRQTERLTDISKDKTLHIAAKTFTDLKPPFFQKHTYVQLGSSEVFINIRSTAKRLGITPDQVKTIAKGGETDLTKAVQTRETVLTKYSELVKKEDWGLAGGNKTLLKICQTSIDPKSNTFKAAKFDISLGLTKHTIYAEPDLKTLSFLEKRLGGGAFGNVFRVKTLDTSGNNIQTTNEAIKESSAKDKDAASLKNEVKIVDKLNENARDPIDGIPDKFKTVRVITSTKGEIIGFVRATLMNGDLFSDGDFIPKFQDMNTKKRLDLCHQLIKGLEHTHKKEIIHGDIKPKNCLIKTNSEGVPERFVLSDFGGSAENKDLATEGVTSTESYRPYEMKTTKWENNAQKIEANKKADVYALGFTLIELLTRQKLTDSVPTQKIMTEMINKKGKNVEKTRYYPDPSQIIPTNNGEEGFYETELRALKNSAIPESIALLLLQAIGPIDKRPSASEFQQKFGEAVGKMTDKEKVAIGEFNRIVDSSQTGF